jgi:hypothetical protein
MVVTLELPNHLVKGTHTFASSLLLILEEKLYKIPSTSTGVSYDCKMNFLEDLDTQEGLLEKT